VGIGEEKEQVGRLQARLAGWGRWLLPVLLLLLLVLLLVLMLMRMLVLVLIDAV
jgi:hypothetical protein